MKNYLKMFRHKNKSRPSRDQLCGYSPSEFKPLLRKLGFKVRRDFFHCYSIKHNGRFYRFRFFCEGGPVVDISCEIDDFDRWANSRESTISLDAFLTDLKEKKNDFRAR